MSKTPKLRFKEFSGEWNHKKSNEIIERVTRKNKGNISNLPLTISAQYGLIDQEKFFNKTVASKNLESYYLLENGEFAYNKSYSNGYPWGAIKRLDKYNMGVLSSLYICFKEKKEINSDYLTHYFETTKWYKEISMVAVEGARNHGLLNISVSDFFHTLHYIPCYEEQQKIANFFSLIDKKIEKQQEKVEALKDYKKGMMQKIFSQEIRFKGDNGEEYPEWEEKKLGEVSDVRDGTHDSPKYVDDGFPFITSKNLLKNGKIDFTDVMYITEEDYITINKRSKVDKGDILFGMIGTIGNPVIVENDGFAIKNVALIKENDKLKNNYLIHLLNSSIIYRQFHVLNSGGTQKFIALGLIRDLDICITSLEEQQKIANFLSTLDKKQEKEQEKLDSLNQWKKGLLQQMFV
ncbi:restriction endonuclease subunit S [Clostridium sp. ZBS4]|uniref:restriction endonuclease subunit S n=1 Tax=Clostridium sp. ZBS4 TaxID=2949974 RepID=UPI0020796B38|nr:restriction endonuclease subunit S [Clostridium sp. ZBS4]